jgi:TfoX/Sxy family transcriptional regulator of competence genes
MAYDHALADRIRAELGDHPALSEREMFGGIAFLVGGNMAVGVTGDELMVRVDPSRHDDELARPGARPFAMTGRPMRGWLVVAANGFATESDFSGWIRTGVSFAESLPPK